jgi:hypothetical protein
MANVNHINTSTLLGTVSGTVLTVWTNISSSDIIKTVVLAVLGATVSFVVSILLRRLFRVR